MLFDSIFYYFFFTFIIISSIRRDNYNNYKLMEVYASSLKLKNLFNMLNLNKVDTIEREVCKHSDFKYI